jgi:hypothetical protein
MAERIASRFDDEPVVRDGAVKRKPPRALTPLNWKMLEALTRYSLLNAEYMAPLVGSDSPDYMTYLFQRLRAKPECYVKLCDEQRDPNSRRYYMHTSLYYQLGEGGITQLQQRGFPIPTRKPIKNFVHQILEDQIMASFEIGAKGNVQQITRDKILESPQTPQRTRDLVEPERIPVSHSGDQPRFYRPDGTFFAINSGGKFFFVPGVEADCATEPIDVTDYNRSSIKRKFKDIITILQNDLHIKHFGAKTFFVPFFFPTERRMKSAMRYWEKETEDCPSVRKNVLFRTHPLFTSIEKPSPTGHAITEPYQRVGYPDFSFV